MKLYIARDGESLGPYTDAQVREYLGTGIFAPAELACRAGEEDWQPLESFFLPPPPPAPAKSYPARNSLALLALAAALVLFGASHGIGNFMLALMVVAAVGLGGLVLAIVALVKGRAAGGIFLLIGWLVLLPIWGFSGWSYAIEVTERDERRARNAAREVPSPTPRKIAVPSTPSPQAEVVNVTPERPAAEVSTAPSTPTVRRLSAPGTFFLTEYVSASTPGGVVGFEPGSVVQFVKADDKSQKLIVTDGKFQVAVSPGQLTNDLDVADLIRSDDQQSQDAVRAAQESALAEYQKSQQQLNIEHASHVGPAVRQASRSADGDPYSYFRQRVPSNTSANRNGGGY